MDPETIRNLPKEHRSTFIWLLLLIFVVALLLDWKLTSIGFIEVLLGYVRSIGGAILTSLFVLWVIVSFIPKSRGAGGLFELEPRLITKEFDALLAGASRWRYKGNFGRYMRGKVLPTLAGRQNCHISVCVLDPSIPELCEKHAKYRRQINSIDKGKKYDANAVALEVLVTIVMCAWYKVNRRVDIDLYLSAVFDPVRIDSNDEAMILTVEDRRQPALKVTGDHFTYEHFEMQMEFARSQARKIQLSGIREGIQLAELSEGDVSSALSGAGMQSLCDRLTAQRILQACKESKNPYEN